MFIHKNVPFSTSVQQTTGKHGCFGENSLLLAVNCFGIKFSHRCLTSLLNRVSYVPACQRGLCANVLACQRGLPANVPACQLLIFTCQLSYGVPLFHLGVPLFQTFLLRNAKENFYTLLLHKKCYILLDIIVMHIICVCILIKNCIILYFFTSCHIKEKHVEFFFFSFFVFCSLVTN